MQWLRHWQSVLAIAVIIMLGAISAESRVELQRVERLRTMLEQTDTNQFGQLAAQRDLATAQLALLRSEEHQALLRACLEPYVLGAGACQALASGH